MTLSKKGALLIGLLAASTLIGCKSNLDVSKPCVAMLGDSIFALSGKETDALEILSGETYRTYYISGAQMIGGFVKPIQEQYYDAAEEGYIRTLILDGGGNDVLIGANKECSAPYGDELSAECYAVMDKVLEKTEEMAMVAAEAGVENFVYQAYYYVKYPSLWQVTDVFLARAIELATRLDIENPDMKFVFVDPRDAFFDQSYIGLDGIHPNAAGSQVLANLLWEAMVENDIEQGNACPTES
ncbi:MAG: SGNH/GDSL hydrolase family protein [Pseudomonadales bacterium]|nr:SGNH/GDSL hydrolase family protein [Pseudomonadales bacterium]